ncbi:hypothetical protein XM38_009950 [Halomicronema hongdechloris C2206]|uniref:Uncharacterized protein n=1 Tax=Halomicronema hongdechloris C2206 TaxID=1641165 RepID=A0A1Z3HID5_9CYAN|nr:hypothetical protein [Halomicronema hongdechloris]ASC70065.1 hypothetical protein XM38_009950 [Halomicronema hongdechloris C2206]
MERGLLWLPLLAIFIALAWAGWNEYRKVEAYKRWATNFERAKYDILAVLGQQGRHVTWGKPTRGEPIDLVSLDLSQVSQLQLIADQEAVRLEAVPDRVRHWGVRFILTNGHHYDVPFTDFELAQHWYTYLQGQIQTLQSASID